MKTSRRTLLKNSAAAAAALSLDWRFASAQAETVRIGVIYDHSGPFAAGGSVACAIGWSAACAACLALARRAPSGGITLSIAERSVAMFGLLVGLSMILMKIVPVVPGHFTAYEWLALGIWIALGAIAAAVRGGAVQ